MYKHYQQYLSHLQHTAKYRTLPDENTANACLNFSSNDYLQLSKHPDSITAAEVALRTFGNGATGSRLLSGNYPLFSVFESQIAKDKNCEAALIYNTGFQANLSVLSALLDKQVLKDRPLVFFDKLNHASLYQAIALSGAELLRYRHNDMNHLQRILDQHKNSARPKFLVSETVFGMDGDICFLNELVCLAKIHQTFLYLDEAHATGLFGPKGYGLSTRIDLTEIPHLIMGTFSKALGGHGAYIACSLTLRNYLVNKCQGLIYSTANSPANIAAAYANWQLIPKLDNQRQQLSQLGDYFRQSLQAMGFNTGTSSTHIIPIILENETRTIAFQKHLLQHDILCSAIRPPTVPPKTSRLRFAIHTAHTKVDIKKVLEHIQ